MKLLFKLLILLSPLSSQAYEHSSIFCSVNNETPVKLSCSGDWTEMESFPEVKIKMKECFGFKSSEYLKIKISNRSETYRSVLFPFATRQDGYTIRCDRDGQ